jgi:hypothetical protein
VWNAVNAAANSWNSATDPYGNKTGYYFVVNQAGGSGQADIIISRDNSLSGSDTGATTTATTVPRAVALNPDLLTQGGAFQPQAAVAHEFGHCIGLDGVVTNALCNGQSATVMQTLNADWTPKYVVPQPIDVQLSNVNLVTPAACTRNVSASVGDTRDGGGGGGGCGWTQQVYEYEVITGEQEGCPCVSTYTVTDWYYCGTYKYSTQYLSGYFCYC